MAGIFESDHEGNGDMAVVLARFAREVADAADRIRTVQGLLPLANGSLMAELAYETDFAADEPWGNDPIMAARNLAVTAMVAAIDDLRAFASGVEAHQPFAPFLTTRGVLEACSVAAYLGEKGIGPRERVRRIMNEKLLDLHDHLRMVKQLDLSASQAEISDRQASVRQMVSTAESFGYAVIAGTRRPFALVERRPSATALISRLFPADLGVILYHLLSASSHSRPSGLLHSVVAGPRTNFGARQANIGLTGRDVTALASTCLLAMGFAMVHLADINGWLTEDWLRVFGPALQYAQAARIHWWNDGT